MRSTHIAGALLTLGLPALSLPAAAQTIDFESLPGGQLVVDQMPITDQFEAEFGISFSLAGGGTPLLAQVGPPQTAFQGVNGASPECGSPGNSQADRPHPTQPGAVELGCFFLTDDAVVGAAPPALIVSYSVPVQQASGYLLDIDFNEQWTLTAKDAGDQVIEQIVLDPPGGNGIASFWSFDVAVPIATIEMEFTGGGASVGLAFDNFSPASAVPCNGAFELYGEGLAGCGDTVPSITTVCPTIGETVSIEIFDGLGGTCGCLLVGSTQLAVPFAGGTQLVNIGSILTHDLGGVFDACGEGSASIPIAIPLDLGLVGQKVYFQAGYIDASAPAGVSLTRGLEMTIGDTAGP